jgi:signal transduction histidine kinase
MIRYLSHEIRSPLNVVINGLTFVYGDLKSGKESISESLDVINDIKHAASSAVTILDNFLDYEKMQSSIFRLEQDWFPSSILIDLVNFHKIFPKEKGIEFNITNNVCESLRLFIDEIKIEQIIRNLIVNSTKFTGKGGSININLRFEEDLDNRSDVKKNTKIGLNLDIISCHGTIFLDVIDSGVGISIGNASKIFNQFSQIDSKNLQGINNILYIYTFLFTKLLIRNIKLEEDRV